MRHGGRKVAVAVAALTALSVAGCTRVAAPAAHTTPASSLVHDNTATLDFQHRPTRASFGFMPGENFRSYGRTGPLIATTVLLPGGALHVPCFQINGASDDTGGAADTTVMHEPKVFDLLRNFATAAEQRASLLADATVLGIASAEITAALTASDGTAAATNAVLHGLVDGWLSVEVSLEGLQADYEISVDRYHNAALDKVVHNGVMRLDLTRTPTRADMAMLDSYRLATVMPQWRQVLRVRLTLPAGVLDRGVSSVTTSSELQVGDDPRGVGRPVTTSIALTATSVAEAERILLADAPLLGLNRAAVSNLAASGPGRVTKTFTGTATDVYAVSARFDATVGQVGSFAAAISYEFRYK
jgi:hypothetical protein